MKRKSSYKRSSEYNALKNAIYRTTNPKHPQYQDYGGRGITVAPEFMCPLTGFQAFIEEVGYKPSAELTLDRIENERGYVPGNLRWSTRSEQQKNKRKPCTHVKDLGWGLKAYTRQRFNCHPITFHSPLVPLGDRIQSLKEWSAELGVSASTLRQRLQRGWSPERALVPTIFNPRGTPRQN